MRGKARSSSRQSERWVVCLAAVALALAAAPLVVRAESARHGLAMHGTLKHSADFKHFSYVNPHAPKGGRINLGELGDFDTLHPFIIKGTPAAGLRDLVYESLLQRALDEPFSLYALIAESVELAPDRSAVTFRLNPKARFSDGRPLTSRDVLFSHAILRDKGLPNHRAYYAKVGSATALGDHAVRFEFRDTEDREMALIIALMPILPAHRWTPESFERTTLDPPVGSGPYVVATIDPGRSITYRRDKEHWSRDLPVNRGRHNFDEVRYTYYLEASAMLGDFQTGAIHFRGETDPKQWAEAYRFPAALDGRIVREELDLHIPAGMTAFVLNTRRPALKDPRVRRALILALDAERLNKSLYHGLYKRTHSYFERSLLASTGRPANQKERALLAPWISRLPAEVIEGRHRFPSARDQAEWRRNLASAIAELKAAGYAIDGATLKSQNDGRPLSLEILVSTRANERLASAYAAQLAQIGIKAGVRLVDTTQYQARLKAFDFDIIHNTWAASLSPGNEQSNRFASTSVDVERSLNYAGVRDPAVDAMIAALLAAETEGDFVSAVRALDRLLISGDYVVPLFHIERQWIARWSHLRRPAVTSLYGYNLHTWWSDQR